MLMKAPRTPSAGSPTIYNFSFSQATVNHSVIIQTMADLPLLAALFPSPVSLACLQKNTEYPLQK